LTQKERIAYCKGCTLKKSDFHKGLLCSLTNKPPNFIDVCSSYTPENKSDEEVILNWAIQKRDSSLEHAKTGRRIANFLLDLFFIFCISFILIVLILITDSILGAKINPDIFFESIFGLFYFTFVFMTYFILCESSTGRTIGKFLTKTYVVDEFGKLPSIKSVTVRSISRLFPFDPISFLFGDVEGWHDKVSKTKVIKS